MPQLADSWRLDDYSRPGAPTFWTAIPIADGQGRVGVLLDVSTRAPALLILATRVALLA